jgi:hypothetical protein
LSQDVWEQKSFGINPSQGKQSGTEKTRHQGLEGESKLLKTHDKQACGDDLNGGVTQ